MTKSTSTSIPRYVIKAPKGKGIKVCNLSIRRVSVDDLEDELTNLFKLAAEDGKKITAVRGTLACY